MRSRARFVKKAVSIQQTAVSLKLDFKLTAES
jgi:hypothetical protein